MRPLLHVSLFSGAGGIDLAAHHAGIRTVLACEKDDAARGVLADRFPGTILHADVRELTADDLRAAGADPGRTVLSAGWPCQGNSVAGHRQGMADPRSGLWGEVARLLGEFRPAWFVGENVDGLLSVNGGRDFGAVLGDLAELGYGFAWRVLDAQHFGVPQRRRRVVIVGRAGGDGAAPVEILFEPEGGSGDSAPGRQAGPDLAGAARSRVAVACVTGRVTHALTSEGADASEDGTGRGTPIIAPALMASIGTNNAQPGNGGKDEMVLAVTTALTARAGSTFDDQQIGQLVTVGALTSPAQGGWRIGADEAAAGHCFPIPGDSVRRLTPLECERLQGWPDGHTATSNGRRQADSPRYAQVGNGVATPVFTWVLKRLASTAPRQPLEGTEPK